MRGFLIILRRYSKIIFLITLLSLGSGITLSYCRIAGLQTFPLAFLSLVFCTVFLFSGNLYLSSTLYSATIIAIHLANRIKIHYYKSPLMASDMVLISDFGNWSVLKHYPEAGLALILLLSLCISPFFVFRNAVIHGKFLRLIVAIPGVLTLAYSVKLTGSEEVQTAWNRSLPKGRNVIANLIFSAINTRVRTPNFSGDATRFSALIDEENFSTQIPKVRPDIFIILQESTVDPLVFNIPHVSFPKLAMFHPSSGDNRISRLRVHTFGGGTWKSEFDVLTGLSCGDFGANKESVFYTVAPHIKYSLPSFLKENGYFTSVLSPFCWGAYNAGKAYDFFGFDSVYQPQDFGYPGEKNENLWHIQSSDLLNYVLQIPRPREDQPLFVFALTMREHGPYRESGPVESGLEHYLPRKVGSKMTDYIHRLKALDAAMLELKRGLDFRNRPYILAYFGDHHPNLSLPQELYHTDFPSPDFLTQVIFTGKDVTFPQLGSLLESSLVPGYIVETAGLPPDSFFKANITARRRFDGRLEDSPDKDAVNDYRKYLYHYIKAIED